MARFKNSDPVVLVTGATGRLGRHLARKLVEDGNTVRVLMFKKEAVPKMIPGTVPFLGSLHDKRILNEACSGVDAVIHLAAIVGEAKAKTDELISTNVEGTGNLLEACKANGVKHIIYASSVDVYGRKRSGTLTEDSETAPTDKYGYSKMLAERKIMGSGVPYTIFRMATIYGPGFEEPFFKMFRAIKERKIVIIGNGKNSLSIVHIEDVVKAYGLALYHPEASMNKVYNLTDGETRTQEELIGLGADLLKAKKPTTHVPEIVVKMLARQRGLDSDEMRFLTSDRRVSTARIQNELGFKASVSAEDGGGELVEMFLNRGGAK